MRRRIYGFYFALGLAALLVALALSARSTSAHVFPCDSFFGVQTAARLPTHPDAPGTLVPWDPTKRNRRPGS